MKNPLPYWYERWEYCQGCDFRVKTDDVTVQRGLRLCPDCVDEE